MADGASASRSDLEALNRAGRGKFLALGGLLAVALAGAGWYFFGQHEGIGSPEDPAKVLIVRSSSSFGFSSVLKEGGFDAAEGTLDHWAERAHREIPELEENGIEAVMVLADTFGYGYVIFESPGDVDFGALELSDTPDLSADHVQFAVVSVGDLAFPPKVTVNPEPSKVLRSVELDLLGALFAQEKLAAALPGSDEGGLEVVQIQDRLSEAMETLERLPLAEKLAGRVADQFAGKLLESERASPKPGLLGGPLESNLGVALSGKDVLSIGRKFSVQTRDGLVPSLVDPGADEFRFGAPGMAPEDQELCNLPEGVAEADGNHYVLSLDGRSMLLGQTDGTAYRLDTDGPGCSFTKLFDGAQAPEVELSALRVHPSGAIAWSTGEYGEGGVMVRTAGEIQELGPARYAEFDPPAWLDGEHLVALSHSTPGTLYLFSTREPGKILRLPSSVILSEEARETDGEPGFTQLSVVPGDPSRIVVTSSRSGLHVITLPASVSELFASPPVAPAAPAEATAQGVDSGDVPEPDVDQPKGETEAEVPELAGVEATTLRVDAFVSKRITPDVWGASHAVVSPDGTWVAFVARNQSVGEDEEHFDGEIAIVPISGGEPRLLTDNAWEDGRPRFTADGQHVLLSSVVEVPRTRSNLNLTRYAPVPKSAQP